MMPIDEIFTDFMDYMSTELPGILAAVGEDDFDDYLIGPPSDVDNKQLAVYLGTCNHDEVYSSEGFMMQAQLPKVLDPIGYRKAIDKAIVNYDPSEVGANSVAFSAAAFYPGEIKDGGMSSFIVYEITITSDLDDCRDDSDY